LNFSTEPSQVNPALLELDDVLKAAVNAAASAIYLSARPDKARIRILANGELQEYAVWPTSQLRQFATDLYQIVAEDDFEESMPQSAQFERDVDAVRYEIKVCSLPAFPLGFDIAILYSVVEN
jgi:type II secretory ATPase GspE/PulE/Tfp pilus assembly ATPase PilB-like protein